MPSCMGSCPKKSSRPSFAIDEVLQRNGKSPEEAFELISAHMWAALTPKTYQKLSRLPFFLPPKAQRIGTHMPAWSEFIEP